MDINYVCRENYAKFNNLKAMKIKLLKNYTNQFKRISGWGKTNFVTVEMASPKTINDITNIIINAQSQSIIARGKGRSYGDAAQLKEGKVLKLNNLKEIYPNYKNQEVTAQSGATIEEILKTIIPQGYFLPVTPGTKNITLGGAIAADVHGKNHHHDGSFGDHIKRIKMINGLGEKITLKPYKEDSGKFNEQFWATIGGMGLTGVIIEATFSIIPIETSFIKEETNRFQRLEDLMQHMIIADNQYKYSVAWIDSMNNNLRGVVTYGNHAQATEIKNKKNKESLSFNPKPITNIPSLIPINLMNKIFIKLFNELWFRKTPKNKKITIQPIEKFFYPLDAIANWNNIYGKDGFIQYQIVVPDEHSKIIKKILMKLKQLNLVSFLPVLKRLGKANKSYLSFPIHGWTLSIDLPANNKRIKKALNEIDKEIQMIGGRIYLAKDSRQSADIFKKTYKSLNHWQTQKKILDPRNIFSSDIATRLKICN